MKESERRALSPAQREVLDAVTDAQIDADDRVRPVAELVAERRATERHRALALEDAQLKVDRATGAIKRLNAAIEAAKDERRQNAVNVAIGATSDDSDRALHKRLLDLARQREVLAIAIETLECSAASAEPALRRARSDLADAEHALHEERHAARLRIAEIR